MLSVNLSLTNTFLGVLSVHQKDHLNCTQILPEADQIKEGGLGEFIDGHVAKPNKELLALVIIHAGEAPAGLGPVDARSSVNLEVLNMAFLKLHKALHCLAVIYRIQIRLI